MRRRARTPLALRLSARRREESGFTLIEILVVLVILPIIIGAVALATITLIKQTGTSDPKGVQARLLDSHDAQITSAYFQNDIAGSVAVYPGSIMTQCGSGTEILGLYLTSGTVSYSAYNDPSAGWELVRYYCVPNGGVFTLSTTTVVSHQVFKSTTAPVNISASCTGYSVVWGYGCANATANGFVGFRVYDATDCPSATNVCTAGRSTGLVASNVSSVQEVLQTYTGAYQFTLGGVPRTGAGAAPSSTSTSPPNNPPATTTTTTLPPGDSFNPPFLTFGPVALQNCSATINGLAAVDDSATPSVTVGSNGSFSASGLYTTDTTNPSGAISPAQSGLTTSAGPPIPDPYAKLTAPSGSTFGGYNVVYETASPWKPSGTITGSGGGTIYVVQNGVKLDGTTGIAGNALLYVTGGNVDLTGGGNVTLSALSPAWENPVTSPAPPTLPEPVIWVPSSNTGATISLGGNGNATTINGAIYAPGAAVSLNGGGSSGALAVQGLVANSYSCTGHDSLTAGSTLSSGTSDFPSSASLSYTSTATIRDVVTVSGVGSLTPTGTVTIYVCGPSATTGCDSSTGTSIGTASLASSGSGSATATSAPYHPTSAGSYCFAAYYGGSASYNLSSDTSTDGCFTVSAPQLPVVTQPVQGDYYAKLGTGSGSTATTPAAWPLAISGTATDTGGPGLASVLVAIQTPGGKWWNGTTFGSTSIQWNAASTSNGWANWTYPFLSTSYPTTGSASSRIGTYTVEVYSADTSGATSTAAVVTYTWQG